MSVVDIVKTIKKVRVQDVVMIKIGKFVYCYGKDACIISYLFKYKIKMLQDNIYVCAFPKDKLNKIMATLENKKINYIQIYERKNKSYISRSFLVRESLLENLYELKDKYGVSICLLINVAIRNTLMEEKMQ